MILSHSRQFIFVHLHKTGGMSIKAALSPFLAPGDVLINSRENNQETTDGLQLSFHDLKKHSPAQKIAATIPVEHWNAYFKFAFVRHPMDRLVSLFEFFNRVQKNAQRESNCPSMDPEVPPWSWPGMKAITTTDDFSGFNRSEHLDRELGARPQARSLARKSGKLLVDFVGKLENMHEDWPIVCEHLKIAGVSLNHENKSHRRYQTLEQYWNPSDRAFVEEKYRSDFELFGYNMDDYLSN